MGYNQPMYNGMNGMQSFASYNSPNTQPYPYQDRMAGLQQYNQNLQSQFPSMQQTVQNVPQVQNVGINGKFIQVVENITANDVPMNGEVALFPKQDMTEIYAKAWQSDGTIKTVVYKPVEPVLDAQANNSTPTQENSLYEAVNNALGAISEKVDALTNRFEEYIGKPKAIRAKKEAETD